jgi:hypothetical protein
MALGVFAARCRAPAGRVFVFLRPADFWQPKIVKNLTIRYPEKPIDKN